MKIYTERRCFLKSAVMSTLGVLLTSCGVRTTSKNDEPFVCDHPAGWVEAQGNLIENYSKFLDKLELENISTHEIIKAHCRNKGGVWNSIPPKKLWKNIVPTLRTVNAICGQENIQVDKIVSLYRSPAYNERCRGAKPNSWHKQNVAMDITMKNSSPSKTYKIFKKYRDRGLFEGGVGSYPSFTHIDCRGYNATW